MSLRELLSPSVRATPMASSGHQATGTTVYEKMEMALVTFPGLIICTCGGPKVVQREPPPPGHEQTWPQPLRRHPLC